VQPGTKDARSHAWDTNILTHKKAPTFRRGPGVASRSTAGGAVKWPGHGKYLTESAQLANVDLRLRLAGKVKNGPVRSVLAPAFTTYERAAGSSVAT